MRFQKINRKEEKNLSANFSFRFVLTRPHWCVFIQKRILLMRFRLSFTLKRPKTLTLFSAQFAKASIPPVHIRNGKFSKRYVFKRLHFWYRFRKFLGILVWVIGENASSKSMCSQTENALVWLGHQQPIVMIISIIFIITITIAVVIVIIIIIAIILSCHHQNSTLQD